MKKVLFAITVLFIMSSCANHVDLDEIKSGIIKVEAERLPLTIQKCDGVNDIRIDSIVIINNVEPYSGYLVTTWDIEKEEYMGYPKGYQTIQESKTIYVEVNDIEINLRSYTWKTDWFGAYINMKY